MYQATVPEAGTRPDAVAAWWGSLTPGEQTMLENAVPLSLYNLDGIPDSVKKQLAGPGPMNRMAFVQYAEDNYTNTSLDWIEKGTNCTLFTSDALAAAGLPTNADWNGSGPSQAPGDFPDPGYSTHSWTGAQNLHDYLTSDPASGGNAPAGHEVPASQAKPGDVIFFKSAPGVSVDGDPQGAVFHTAIVTAVLPDGNILYTQHSDGMENLSVDGRTETVQQNEGQGQTVTPVIVHIGS